MKRIFPWWRWDQVLLVMGLFYGGYLLQSCTGTGLFAASFDPVEYGHVVDARYALHQSTDNCNDYLELALAHARDAQVAAGKAFLYSSKIPDDKSITDALGKIDHLMSELVTRLEAGSSTLYCQTKGNEIDAALAALQTSMGKEHRP